MHQENTGKKTRKREKKDNKKEKKCEKEEIRKQKRKKEKKNKTFPPFTETSSIYIWILLFQWHKN